MEKQKEIISHLIKRYFSSSLFEDIPLQVTKPTRLFQQTQILDLFKYRRYAKEAASFIEGEAIRLAAIHSKPSYVVRELLRFLGRERIIVPAYSTLQNLVGMAVQKEANRLETRTGKMFSEEEKINLDNLDSVVTR